MKHLSSTWQTHQKFFLAFAIILLLAQCLFLYGNTARDDAFFTYWPAYSLAEHGSILNALSCLHAIGVGGSHYPFHIHIAP